MHLNNSFLPRTLSAFAHQLMPDGSVIIPNFILLFHLYNVLLWVFVSSWCQLLGWLLSDLAFTSKTSPFWKLITQENGTALQKLYEVLLSPDGDSKSPHSFTIHQNFIYTLDDALPRIARSYFSIIHNFSFITTKCLI